MKRFPPPPLTLPPPSPTPALPLTLVFLSMRSGAARGRASSNRSSYGGAGLSLVPSSEAKQSGMEQGGGRSSDPAEAPPSGVEVSTAWRDLESPAGGPGGGSALRTRALKVSPGAGECGRLTVTVAVTVLVIGHVALSLHLLLRDCSGAICVSEQLQQSNNNIKEKKQKKNNGSH